MTDLPQATQAVLKAVQATLPDYMLTDSTAGCFAAAALRAVAGQVFPVKYVVIDNCQYEVPIPEREQILAIANELENV